MAKPASQIPCTARDSSILLPITGHHGPSAEIVSLIDTVRFPDGMGPVSGKPTPAAVSGSQSQVNRCRERPSMR